MTEAATDKQPESTAEKAPSAPDQMPEYKGAPLDAERGPGLGCFWFQVVLLAVLLVVTPLSVVMAAPSWFSATLLIVSLVLLFFVGQTMIFLLRLVAADRRARRHPLRSDARPTVGQMEDEATPEGERGANDDELRRLIPAVVRGEARWQSLLEHGLVVRPAPPFDVMETPSHFPTVEVGVDDLVAGLRAHAARATDLRLWAFVVIGIADFGDITDTEIGEQIASLLHDASFGTDPAEISARLADLGFPRDSDEDDAATQ